MSDHSHTNASPYKNLNDLDCCQHSNWDKFVCEQTRSDFFSVLNASLFNELDNKKMNLSKICLTRIDLKFSEFNLQSIWPIISFPFLRRMSPFYLLNVTTFWCLQCTVNGFFQNFRVSNFLCQKTFWKNSKLIQSLSKLSTSSISTLYHINISPVCKSCQLLHKQLFSFSSLCEFTLSPFKLFS